MTEQTHRRGSDERRGIQALAESLQLQKSVQQRANVATPRRGRRRKGNVIDLTQLAVTRSRRRRIFMTLLVVEALVAVMAVSVLVVYLVLQGDTLQ